MEDFPSNSIRGKLEQNDEPEDTKGITKIVTGEVITRKPSGFKRLRQSFIRGDATSVSEHVLWNVLIPAAKDTLADMGTTFIDMMIYGERRGRTPGGSAPSSGQGSTSKFNYNGISSGGSRLVLGGPPERVEIPGGRYTPTEVIVSSRAEAEAIVEEMLKIIEKYNAVTVADRNRMMGISSQYTDDKWGWTSLENAHLKRVRDGVLLVLPNPEDLTR